MGSSDARRGERVLEVRRIFEDLGFGNIELLEGWNGDDLEELTDFLTEEEFESLLDELGDLDDRAAHSSPY